MNYCRFLSHFKRFLKFSPNYSLSHLPVFCLVLLGAFQTGCWWAKPQNKPAKFEPNTFASFSPKWVSKYGRQSPYARIGTPAQLREARKEIKKRAFEAAAKENAEQENDEEKAKQYREVEFIPAPALESSRGQRILIIEPRRLEVTTRYCLQFRTAFTSYRKRVLDAVFFSNLKHFKTGNPGTYESPKIRIRYSESAASALDDFESLPYIVPGQILSVTSAKSFRGFGSHQFELAVFGEKFDCVHNYHGDPIFQYLADFNPEAQFVLADIPASFESALREEKPSISIDDYREYMNRWASETLRLISKYEINLVSMSWGVQSTEKGDWTGRDEYYDILLKAIERIAKESGIPIIQAAPNVDDDLALLDSTVHPGVRQELQQRVPGLFKVGTLSRRDPQSPLEGRGDDSWLPRGMKAIWDSVDLYVNNGAGSPDVPRFVPTDNSYEAIWGEEAKEHHNAKLLTLYDRYIDGNLSQNRYPKIDEYFGLTYRYPFSLFPYITPFSYVSGKWAVHEDLYRRGNSFGTPIAVSFINALYQEGYWRTVEELENLLKPEGRPRLYSPIHNGILELYLAMDQIQYGLRSSNKLSDQPQSLER